MLVVEDNNVNRCVAVTLAERLGCQVEAVEGGREAVEAAANGEHDLILMDVQMPEMDGHAATAEIRRREAGTSRHIPIIALTAHAMEGDAARCLESGMDDYLTKPIRLEPLRDALLRWGTKRARATAAQRSDCLREQEQSDARSPRR